MSKGEGSRRRGWTTRLSRGWGEAWRGVARCGAVWRGSGAARRVRGGDGVAMEEENGGSTRGRRVGGEGG